MVKKMSARSSRVPKARAHQASEVPHPSHVPLFEVGSMVVVRSAAALRTSANVRTSRATELDIMILGRYCSTGLVGDIQYMRQIISTLSIGRCLESMYVYHAIKTCPGSRAQCRTAFPYYYTMGYTDIPSASREAKSTVIRHTAKIPMFLRSKMACMRMGYLTPDFRISTNVRWAMGHGPRDGIGRFRFDGRENRSSTFDLLRGTLVYGVRVCRSRAC